ncbi:MAG: purine nucleoside phosphorylase I, inosine and guanosine-specific [Tannerella sp.]|jgi:purine-nucleoside phosphorylase|nr:purine nucleoside phosphorylase I, inosine and guanosine-specific [Tannerella sp.]
MDYIKSANFIAEHIQNIPDTALILGSGLGSLVDSIDNKTVIPYSEIPGFVKSTATGHKGNLLCGSLNGKHILVMQGRFHYYEGYSMQEVTFPVRVMKLLGVRNLLITNAAGGINHTFRVGDLMVITDHINLAPNPLVGQNDDRFGIRFPDMTHAYDRSLIALADEIAAEKGLVLRKGVYVGLTGPSFETPAEYAFCGKIGGDAVGMSTVAEVIVARHAGMKVFGLSVISNEGHHFAHDFANSGEDVIHAAAKAADNVVMLFKELIIRR